MFGADIFKFNLSGGEFENTIFVNFVADQFVTYKENVIIQYTHKSSNYIIYSILSRKKNTILYVKAQDRNHCRWSVFH